MTGSFRVTPRAQDDLKEIGRYTNVIKLRMIVCFCRVRSTHQLFLC